MHICATMNWRRLTRFLSRCFLYFDTLIQLYPIYRISSVQSFQIPNHSKLFSDFFAFESVRKRANEDKESPRSVFSLLSSLIFRAESEKKAVGISVTLSHRRSFPVVLSSLRSYDSLKLCVHSSLIRDEKPDLTSHLTCCCSKLLSLPFGCVFIPIFFLSLFYFKHHRFRFRKSAHLLF